MGKLIQNYRYGPVSISVFENTGSKNGKEFTTKSFQLVKNYKVEDEWKQTNSYKAGELINVIQCAQSALNDYYERNKDTTENVEAPAVF